MAKLPERLFPAFTVAGALSIAVSLSANAQPLPVPCYAFQQDALGN